MSSTTPESLEAKIVVLGSQGVGKTSLVHRYVQNTFIPVDKAQTTIGASFLTNKVHDAESGTTLRLQIWDTAGQERFRSISRLYYRGANAAILCYDVTSKKSFEEMGRWLKELLENCGTEEENDMILHIVGTKSDVVASAPKKREVSFEQCVEYIAQTLYPQAIAQAATATSHGSPPSRQGLANLGPVTSPPSNRSSGFWGQEHIWDCCHEISAKDGEGIEEVFRVITRKLVDQHVKRQERLKMMEYAVSMGKTHGTEGNPGAASYFDLPNGGNGSFRVGHGDKRRSWLGSLATPGGLSNHEDEGPSQEEVKNRARRGRCC